MYGAITKNPDFYEEYVSLNQLDTLDEPEKLGYCHNACNISVCILVFASFYGAIFYLVFYWL